MGNVHYSEMGFAETLQASKSKYNPKATFPAKSYKNEFIKHLYMQWSFYNPTLLYDKWSIKTCHLEHITKMQ